MRKQQNPIVWVLWLLSVTTLIASTRSPLYLCVAALACGVVFLSVNQGNALATGWGTVLRVAVLVAAVTVLFNLLTVHAGDRLLYRLPDDLPIVGGPGTINALVYGATSAGAILILILAAAAFSQAVDRAALLRSVPASVSSAGIAAIIALSFFPQMLAALRDVREAQAARGFRVRSFRDLPPIAIPVLHLGLERAFRLAETIESRGYGARSGLNRPSRALAIAGLVAAATGVTLLGLGAGFRAAALLIVGFTALALALRGAASRRGRYRPNAWTHAEIASASASVASITMLVASVAAWPEQLSWSPYPALTWPTFGLLPGLASFLLVAPAALLSEPP